MQLTAPFAAGDDTALLGGCSGVGSFRLGGLMLAERLPRSGPLRAFLDALPGTILVALVVPSALNSGWQGLIGVAACLTVYFKTKNLLLTMFSGVFTVYLIRQFGL